MNINEKTVHLATKYEKKYVFVLKIVGLLCLKGLEFLKIKVSGTLLKIFISN